MTNRETLLALAARVEAGETGDQINSEVMAAVAAPEDASVKQSSINGAWCIYVGENLWERRDWWRHGGWPLTTSLDAIAALTERVLPDAKWEISTGRRCPGEDCWWATAIIGARRYKVHAITRCAAELAALLRALAEKDDQERIEQ